MQLLLNGLSDGFPIALLALATAIIHAGTRLIALALAGVYAATPFIATQALSYDAPAVLAIALALTCGLMLACLAEFGVHRPLARRGTSASAQVIAGLGVYIVVVQGLSILWDSDPRLLFPGASVLYRPGGLAISGSQLILLVSAPTVLLLFFAWLHRSSLGMHLRAMVDNPVEMQLRGHDTDRLRSVAFMLAGFLTANASLLVALDSGFDAGMGLHALLLALAAMIMGGRSFGGVVIAALVIGLLRAAIGNWWDTRWQDAMTFLLLFAILLVRPQGLFGRPWRVEASA